METKALPLELRQVASALGLHFLSCTAGTGVCPHRLLMKIRLGKAL